MNKRLVTPPKLTTVGRVGDPNPAPFDRAQLDNGARVLVRANRAQPIVAVDLWLGVGAVDETDEHVGISHFLEHMFFKGTERFPLGAMDRLVKEMGGYNNAATSLEFTHYFIVSPSEYFETSLDLLTEHLLRPTLPPRELERERRVVKEEIRRRNDSPHGRLFTRLSRAVFGDSPYGREVLGTPESLDRISTDVMHRYWSDHYAAERLVVAIAGDIDPATVVEQVAERLDPLRRGAAGTTPPEPPPPTADPVQDTMEINQGYLAWGFRTAGRADLDELCALEVASTVLGYGMTSRLYRRLIDELRLVTSVSAWMYALGATGVLGIDAVCAPDKRAQVEAEISAVVSTVIEASFDEEELHRAKAMLVADFAYANETNGAVTGTLGEHEVLFGDAGAFRRLLEGIAAVTVEDATRALAERGDPTKAVRAWVGPDGA
ncbi:MAG: insulinase family protein [Gemmatimonadetes bacterium]|nr:insulinase family protein [Gemmatimonadota bacterium]